MTHRGNNGNVESNITLAVAAKVDSLSLAARLIGKVLTIVHRILGWHRYDDFRMEQVLDTPIIVTPSVFNPKLLRTGEFFAAQIKIMQIPLGWDVLDMGTGSGVCAIFAARQARRVVAADINIAAVRCAEINARLNRLEAKIEVRHGDLFASVPTERFDLILFNPPFLRGVPLDDRDRAWRSSDVAERFAVGLGDHLKPGGYALVLLSTFGGGRQFLDAFCKRGLTISVHAERRFINERLTIFKILTADTKSV